MAKGGWKNASFQLGPFSNTFDNWTNAFNNMGFALASTNGTLSTGQINTVAGSLLIDGEGFVLHDGFNPAVSYEFDSDASVVETDVYRAVTFTGGDTADQVRDAIITAITNTPTLNIDASNGGAGVVSLVSTTPGNFNEAIVETVTDAGFTVSGMSGGTGWGPKQQATRYDSGDGGSWWASWEHTSGAILVFVANISDNNSNNVNDLRGTNNVTGTDYTVGYTWRWCVGWGYIPPAGNAGYSGSGPNVDNLFGNGGFKFILTGYDEPATSLSLYNIYDGSNSSEMIHFICKDDEVFILWEQKAQSSRTFDMMWAFGGLLGTLAHPSVDNDTDWNKEVAFAVVTAAGGMGALNDADSSLSFFRSGYSGDGTTRAPVDRNDGCTVTWISTGLDTTVHEFGTLGTEPWVSPVVYITRTSDIDSQGVIPGNGMKGVIDPDSFRLVQANSLATRTTLDGGNFFYIGGGMAIGWDPGNGPLD